MWILRLLFVAVLGAAAFVWIEAAWDPQGRTLLLRVRSGNEISGMLRQQSISVADRVAEKLRGEVPISDLPTVGTPPPVGAAPPRRARAGERISGEEQGALDSLIEQKTRE